MQWGLAVKASQKPSTSTQQRMSRMLSSSHIHSGLVGSNLSLHLPRRSSSSACGPPAVCVRPGAMWWSLSVRGTGRAVQRSAQRESSSPRSIRCLHSKESAPSASVTSSISCISNRSRSVTSSGRGSSSGRAVRLTSALMDSGWPPRGNANSKRQQRGVEAGRSQVEALLSPTSRLVMCTPSVWGTLAAFMNSASRGAAECPPMRTLTVLTRRRDLVRRNCPRSLSLQPSPRSSSSATALVTFWPSPSWRQASVSQRSARDSWTKRSSVVKQSANALSKRVLTSHSRAMGTRAMVTKN
mmetsp:Transcript_20718/g.79452  ORF Transcript_20718/g.79452 Transcript_20718/m.79452 type:complete len:298 (-) Transcript_20718:995-1888(-)